ncbi:thiol peroxidase [Fulvivirga sedimenti]|uniref:Thiol peroxidase n=1 Tax=Fulvivirga sedimenti TaxID=2879465 RepID=A0A9X1KXP5_9BACT|nr:thiol peroxidase [Fulvivirga sedimenti]MCA6074828.1 thiol peroxidase [Fulvivirga sedimenti]MCA6076005.1 thiol peroxidase [Fulvivirga sedimenti]MCA6077133.1 thiol peroxidase [Fulvivirga sedimenti]
MAQITLGGSVCHTSGELPSHGTHIKNYAFSQNNLQPFHLQDARGKRVILNIFPSIDTAVCATSVRTFNKEAANLDNTLVLCISKDLPFAQARFCGAEGIENVQTLSDFKDTSFSKDMGVLIEDGPFGGLDARAVIVLDEEMKVIHTELVSEIGHEPDYKAAMKVLQE